MWGSLKLAPRTLHQAERRFCWLPLESRCAWRLDFGCGREPRSPDVPFDRVTPSPWVLIVRRQECDSTPGGTAELRAYLWSIRRLSRGCRHQMLCLTHLPALHHRQLGFLSLPSPAPPAPGSMFLSRCRSLGLARVGLGVWQKQAKKPRAVYLTELS